MQSPGRIAFSIAGFDILWYGILIAAGMLLALALIYYRAPRHNIKPEDTIDIAIFSIPIGVIGARLYYVIFNWNQYSGSLSHIFNIREGGLAIHGGIIFGVLTAIVVCRIKKLPFLEMADLFFPGIVLAQAIGRWGNFFNEEAHGVETTLPWAVIIDDKSYHPTFLYESIWCFIIFIALLLVDRNRKFAGQITCLYGMLYSAERFFVEGLRTDSLMIGSLRQAQVLSVCVLIFCAVLYKYLASRAKQGDTK